MFSNLRPLARKALLMVKCEWLKTDIIKCMSFRAAVLDSFGKKLNVKKLKNIVKLQENELLIGVKYCSLNELDVRLTDENLKINLPFVLGREFSGQVLRAGTKNCIMNDYKMGDGVVCVTDGGGLAQEAIVKVDQCWKIPSGLQLQEAAVLPISYGTAFLTLSQFCEIKENDLVLITAGPAGLGLAALDVCTNLYKAKVIVIYDTESSSDIAREKGAYKTIKFNKNSKKLYKELEETLKGKKAIAAYDAIGGSLLNVLADFVDPDKGKLFSVDQFFDDEARYPDLLTKTKNVESKIQHIDLNQLQNDDKDLYRQLVGESLMLASEKLIDGHISKIFSLNQINSAFDFIKNKECTGKVLINVEDEDEILDLDKKSNDE